MDIKKDLDQKVDAANAQLSEGEIIMGITFNPSGRNDVNRIKLAAANLYDWLVKQCTIVNKEGDMDRHNRKQRCKAVALTFLETFQMNAVKAVTYTEEMLNMERSIKPVPTDGYMVMTLDFNFQQREDVAHIKKTCADIYDDMEDELGFRQIFFRAAEALFMTNWRKQQEKEFNDLPDDQKELKLKERAQQQNFASPQWPDDLILLSRKINHSNGAMGDALHALRQFQMYAVKAVTR
ncbi:MAG: hypothetical protein ACQUYJ_13660 [Ferruginibacter sp.]